MDGNMRSPFAWMKPVPHVHTAHVGDAPLPRPAGPAAAPEAGCWDAQLGLHGAMIREMMLSTACSITSDRYSQDPDMN